MTREWIKIHIDHTIFECVSRNFDHNLNCFNKQNRNPIKTKSKGAKTFPILWYTCCSPPAPNMLNIEFAICFDNKSSPKWSGARFDKKRFVFIHFKQWRKQLNSSCRRRTNYKNQLFFFFLVCDANKIKFMSSIWNEQLLRLLTFKWSSWMFMGDMANSCKLSFELSFAAVSTTVFCRTQFQVQFSAEFLPHDKHQNKTTFRLSDVAQKQCQTKKWANLFILLMQISAFIEALLSNNCQASSENARSID